jgi:hypothetical protein
MTAKASWLFRNLPRHYCCKTITRRTAQLRCSIYPPHYVECTKHQNVPANQKNDEQSHKKQIVDLTSYINDNTPEDVTFSPQEIASILVEQNQTYTLVGNNVVTNPTATARWFDDRLRARPCNGSSGGLQKHEQAVKYLLPTPKRSSWPAFTHEAHVTLKNARWTNTY